MADIELIPRDYAALRLLRKRLRRLGIAVGLIVVLAALGRGGLAWRLSVERPQVEAMKQAERAGAERRSRLLAMQTRVSEAGAQTAALRALRHGAAWETVFRAVVTG